MKKVFATILALIYFITSTGATVNIHYCMGKLYAVDLVATTKCGKCGMENDKGGCCKDEIKTVKLNDSHQPATAQIAFTAPVAVIHNYPSPLAFADAIVIPKAATKNNSPPGSSGTSRCVLNCVFRL